MEENNYNIKTILDQYVEQVHFGLAREYVELILSCDDLEETKSCLQGLGFEDPINYLVSLLANDRVLIYPDKDDAFHRCDTLIGKSDRYKFLEEKNINPKKLAGRILKVNFVDKKVDLPAYSVVRKYCEALHAIGVKPEQILLESSDTDDEEG